MATTVTNYAQKWEQSIKGVYEDSLLTTDLTSQGVIFEGVKGVYIPHLSIDTYKNHDRNSAFGFGNMTLNEDHKILSFDRSISFPVDTMDTNESNYVLSAANVYGEFLRLNAVPETDAYRFSKILADYTGFGGVSDTTAITDANVLELFDNYQQQMDEASVPREGRVLYVLPAIYTLLKNAAGLTRFMNVSVPTSAGVNRNISYLDDVKIVRVPSIRMNSAYNWTAPSLTPATTAKQIRMMMVHPSSTIAVVKHSYIKIWEPGTYPGRDATVVESRTYQDAFALETRIGGIKVNMEA